MPTIAVLTEDEKARVRMHLGYFSLNSAPAIGLGLPRADQSLFLVEIAMNQIPDTAIGLVRERIAILDNIEQRLVGAMDRMKAEKLGEITLRADETDALEREFVRWATRLADLLACPLNPYSERFRAGAGGGPRSMNIAVRN